MCVEQGVAPVAALKRVVGSSRCCFIPSYDDRWEFLHPFEREGESTSFIMKSSSFDFLSMTVPVQDVSRLKTVKAIPLANK